MQKLSFAYLSALIIWALLSYLTIFQFLADGQLFARTLGGRPFVNDFASYYTAAILSKRCLTEKTPIYDVQIQNQVLKQIIAPVVPELPFYLQYPPFFFALVLPLSFVSITAAWAIWNILSLLLISISTLGLFQFLKKSKGDYIFAITSVFCLFPTWLGFELGQTSLLLMPFFYFFWHFLRRQNPFKAGLAAALISLKFQYLPLAFIVGLILGRLKFFAGFVLGMCLLLAIAAGVVGIDNVINYPQALYNGETSSTLSGVAVGEMQNFRGWFYLFFHNDSKYIHLASIAIMFLALAFVAYLWIKNGAEKTLGNYKFNLLAALTTLTILITSLHTHIQDFILAIIPCAYLFAAVVNVSNSSKATKWLKILIIAFPALSWIFFLVKDLLAIITIEPYFVWALALIFLTLKLLPDASYNAVQDK